MISRFIRDFLKASLGLTPAIFLVTTLQVRVAPAGVIKPGALRGGRGERNAPIAKLLKNSSELHV